MGFLTLFIAGVVSILAFSGGKALANTIPVPGSGGALVRGASGTTWEVEPMLHGTSSWLRVQVSLDRHPILVYEQRGSELSTRRLVDYPVGVSSVLLARARKDFGV